MEGDFSTNITSEGKDEQTYELETECERLLKDMEDFYSVSLNALREMPNGQLNL